MAQSAVGFGEHLGELRRRLKVIFVSLLVLILLVLLLPLRPYELLSFNTIYYTTPVSVLLNKVVTDILPAGWTLIGFHLNEPLEVLLVASLVVAVALDMPIIAYEVYRFIDPALKDQERHLIYPFIASSTGLFLFGIAFGYFILARFIIIALSPFFIATHASPLIDLADFYFVIFLTVLFSGAAFTVPVFVFVLLRLGVLSAAFFTKNRVIIWVGVYLVTAIVTPDGGPLLDLLLFVPIIALLKLSVFLGKRYAPAHGEKGVSRCKYCSSALDGKLFCANCGRAVL